MTPLQRATQSLQGLSVGDAFGEETLKYPDALRSRWLSRARPWRWSDDTAQALAVFETLRAHSRIDPDDLLRRLVATFIADPRRGYGMATRDQLLAIHQGMPGPAAATLLFPQGSYGNGSAMRAPPIGAFFADDPARAAEEGERAAAVTHIHPEGRAGGRAVAVAAALAASPHPPQGTDFLDAVCAHLAPETLLARRLRLARSIAHDDLPEAIERLGNGQAISAQDTVPLCLWVVAHCMEDYEAALWRTAAAQGDADTTCAIVGGIVALRSPVPLDWLDAREPLSR